MRKPLFRQIAIVAALGSAIALSTTPTLAAITSRADSLANPRGWSAIAGMDVQSVIDLAQNLPLSSEATEDQPYCTQSGQMARALKDDFDEVLVAHGAQDTSLWGSQEMGTWTLTLNRADRTSCVIASGVGYSKHANPMQFYHQAGLKG